MNEYPDYSVGYVVLATISCCTHESELLVGQFFQSFIIQIRGLQSRHVTRKQPQGYAARSVGELEGVGLVVQASHWVLQRHER